MKCRMMRHFIRVYTVCKVNKILRQKNIFFLNYNPTPLDMYNGLSEVYCIKPEGKIHYYTKGKCLCRPQIIIWLVRKLLAKP